MSGNRKKRKKNQKHHVHLYIPFWIIICAFFGIAIFMQMTKYEELMQDERRIESEIEKEDKLTAELDRELKYYESDAYIEKIARERLDLVMPDETIFYNIAED